MKDKWKRKKKNANNKNNNVSAGRFTVGGMNGAGVWACTWTFKDDMRILT